MARYTRIRGPAANFTLPNVSTLIPGLDFTRFWDDGELLIIISCRVNNAGGGTTTTDLEPFIDVTTPPGNPLRHTSVIGELFTLTGAYLVSFTEGIHRIRLQALSSTNNGAIVQAGGCSLICIQLPLWDQDVNLITL